MSRNEITGDTMTTKSSSVYSDNYDNIFRKSKKVYYAIKYSDGMEDYIAFESENDANEYYIQHKTEFLIFEKQQLIQE